MAKSAVDPFFGMHTTPLASPRVGSLVTPSDTADLPHVTTSLIVTIGSGGTGICVLYANQPLDSSPVAIQIAAGTYQFHMQVRRVMVTGTSLGVGGCVVAQWT